MGVRANPDGVALVEGSPYAEKGNRAGGQRHYWRVLARGTDETLGVTARSRTPMGRRLEGKYLPSRMQEVTNREISEQAIELAQFSDRNSSTVIPAWPQHYPMSCGIGGHLWRMVHLVNLNRSGFAGG